MKTLISFLIVLAAFILPGCNAYMLQGKVVRGEYSGIELVYQTDERLQQQGVAGTEVRITRDPTKPNRHLVCQTRSNPGGEFTVVMDEFGTGWMSEQWLVQGASNGFNNAEQLLELPSKGGKWRLLITLAPGTAEPFRDEDLMQDLEKYK